MWMFLATEILFFGGIFLAYTCLPAISAEDFADVAAAERTVAGINTMLLLTSSLTIMLAIRAAQLGNRSSLLFNLARRLCWASASSGLKTYEYIQDYEEGLVPWCHNFGKEERCTTRRATREPRRPSTSNGPKRVSPRNASGCS